MKVKNIVKLINADTIDVEGNGIYERIKSKDTTYNISRKIGKMKVASIKSEFESEVK